MDGLVFYADTLAHWLDQLTFLWDYLQTPVYVVLDNFYGGSNLGIAANIVSVINTFLRFSGLGDLTLLSFIFTMTGTGFFLYFGFIILKWFWDLFT